MGRYVSPGIADAFRSVETALASQLGLVSVHKYTPIPRLSIVVPIGPDLAAFESTLISVLENQPAGCELLVAHDGTYDDPFDLCDEVKFVIADSDHLGDLVSAAALAARGRHIHLLADGIRATPGWVDEALEKFEHFDAAAVAPVIRHAASGRIIAAGWCDGVDRLCKNAMQGQQEARSRRPLLIGSYLQASFWRAEILRALSQVLTVFPPETLAYLSEHVIREAGWRSVLADQCDTLCDQTSLPWESTSFGRGSRLRAIRNHFGHGGWSRSLSATLRAVLANLLRPRWVAESVGQATAPLAARELIASLDHVRIPQAKEQIVQFARPAA